MSIRRGDASEIYALADDLAAAVVKPLPVLREVVQDGMSAIKDRWRDNARATSGAHGRLYPDSITYETHLLADAVTGEVGPDSSKPQGGMGLGFEFGSRNQPPHLDGARALDEVTPNLERRIDAAIGFLFP